MGKLRKIGRVLCAVGALLLLSSCGLFDTTHYTLHLADNDPPLAKDLNAVLKSRAGAIKPAKDKAEQAEQQDYQEELIKAELEKKLRSEGYYEGRVTVTRTPGKAWTGEFSAVAGPRYSIAALAIHPDSYEKFRAATALRPGMPLDAAIVLKGQAALNTAVAKGQCFFTLDVNNDVVLNRTAHTGDVTFTVAAGQPAHFGDVTFVGNGDVNLPYLYNSIPWKNGECYDHGKIDAFRSTLLGTGLFASVDAVLPKAPLPGGAVPITFRLKTRAARSVNAGFNYYTDQGFGATLGWTHRNVFGNGELFTLTGTLSSLIQSVTATLTKPFFLRKDQTLTLTADVNHQDSDAYRDSGFDIGGTVTRNLTPHLAAGTGIKFSVSHIDDRSTEENDNYALISFPQTLTFDNRDNALNATKGWYLTGGVQPYFDTLGESEPFFKTTLGARTYLKVPYAGDTILALRLNGGSILGQGTVNIPATERFYSGGGGSVRGFGYQDIGPFKNGQPTGGRSLAEGSAELRFKVTDTIGFVTFLDAGDVEEGILPNFSNLSLGTGVGFRYYTSFGPLRFDVGVPLNHRETASGNYQLYISIGQAF